MTANPDSHVGPQQRQRPTGDIIATVVMLVLAATAGVLVFSFSPFFAMAADPCGDNNCNTQPISWAYLVTWGGLGLAAVVAIGGTFFAALRQRAMWLWPTIALVLIAVTFIVGLLLAGSVTPHR